MLTSCKMSSSFGITQSSSEASLAEGRESIRVNVRKRERKQRHRISQVSNTIKHTIHTSTVEIRAEGLDDVRTLLGIVGDVFYMNKDEHR